MGRFFNWVGKLIIAILKAIKSVIFGIIAFFVRNWKWYMIAMIFVVGLTIYKCFQPPVYNCTMRLTSNCAGASYAINRINSWNYKIYLPDSISEKIVAVNPCYLLDYDFDGYADAVEEYDSQVMKDTTRSYIRNRMKNAFEVDIEIQITNDTTILDTIRNAVIDYLTHDKWIEVRYEIFHKESKILIERYNKEIAVLDSLQMKDYFNSDEKRYGTVSEGSMLISEKDKHLYHNDIAALISKQLQKERDYDKPPYEIMKDISLPLYPINNLVANAKRSFILIMLLATIVIVIFDRKNAIKKLIEESKEALQ
jgi:hypothetical protein